MTAYAHSLGLTAGFYGNNCICRDHCSDPSCYEGDVNATIAFGFDSIKLDNCGAETDLDLWWNLFAAAGKVSNRIQCALLQSAFIAHLLLSCCAPFPVCRPCFAERARGELPLGLDSAQRHVVPLQLLPQQRRHQCALRKHRDQLEQRAAAGRQEPVHASVLVRLLLQALPAAFFRCAAVHNCSADSLWKASNFIHVGAPILPAAATAALSTSDCRLLRLPPVVLRHAHDVFAPRPCRAYPDMLEGACPAHQ